MGNVHMEATQINYRGGSKKMSVEEAIKAAGTEITPEEKAWIDTIPDLASQEIIAPEFDAEEGVYAVGDLVIYQGGLYQFTTAHETAGAWNAEEVAAVKISDELDSLKSGLTNVAQTVNHTVLYSAQDLHITGVNAFKNANTICVAVTISLSNYTAGEWYVIGTLPSELRPRAEMRFCAYNNTVISKEMAYTYPVRIQTNGELGVYIWGDVTGGVSISQAFTYIADDVV